MMRPFNPAPTGCPTSHVKPAADEARSYHAQQGDNAKSP